MGRGRWAANLFKKAPKAVHTPPIPRLPVKNKAISKVASGGVHINEAAAISRGAGAGKFVVGAAKATVITVGGLSAVSAAQEMRRAAAQAKGDGP